MAVVCCGWYECAWLQAVHRRLWKQRVELNYHCHNPQVQVKQAIVQIAANAVRMLHVEAG